mgnify:CR=1 FL=1
MQYLEEWLLKLHACWCLQYVKLFLLVPSSLLHSYQFCFQGTITTLQFLLLRFLKKDQINFVLSFSNEFVHWNLFSLLCFVIPEGLSTENPEHLAQLHQTPEYPESKFENIPLEYELNYKLIQAWRDSYLRKEVQWCSIRSTSKYLIWNMGRNFSISMCTTCQSCMTSC